MALVTWNAVLAGVVLVIEPRVSPALMVALHLGLAALCGWALSGSIRIELCLVLAFCLWTADCLVARSLNDGLTLAACWLGDLLYVGTAICLRSGLRSWLPIVGSAVTATLAASTTSVWDLQAASALVVTAIVVVITARFAMPRLWNLAEAADEDANALEEQRRAEALVRHTSRESAEDARVLHDTVVNTLGAVANSGRHVLMIDAMRDRCLRDFHIVEEMLRGRRERRVDLTRLGRSVDAVTIERTGLSDQDLSELADLLPADSVNALVGAVEEAVRNVAKHAGVNQATIDIHRSEGTVRISVVDHGSGFDTASSTSGRGLADSIYSRVEAVGGEARVASRVGHGTEVVIGLTLQASGPSSADAGESVTDADTAQQLTRRAAWLMSVGIVLVGVMIELANRPGVLSWTYAMLAISAVCIAASYGVMRRATVVPDPLAAVLTIALSAAFVADMAGIDFGRDHVFTYQAIGIVPIMLILVSNTRLFWTALAVSLLVLTATVLTVVMWLQSADLGVIVLIGVAPAIGLGLGWLEFQRLITRLIDESAATRQKAFVKSVDAAIQVEMAQARQRWGTASLERAASLLQGIGNSQLDPGDPHVQEACAAEELHLRQILLLSPQSYRMSVWFAHALALARSRGVGLTIRSGDRDAPDNESAEVIGNLVLDTLTRGRRGDAFTVGWFPSGAGIQLSIVKPLGEGEPASYPMPATWQMNRSVIADHEMIEVLVAS